MTNYEVNSKTVSTQTNGYIVEKLAIALVINHKRIEGLLGKDATVEQINAQVDDIRKLVESAAGFNETRGDSLKVTAVDFMETSSSLQPVPGPSITQQLLPHSGSVISALTVLIATFLLVWFGLRPAARVLTEPAVAVDPDLQVLEAPESEAEGAEAEPETDSQLKDDTTEPNLVQDLTGQIQRRPQQRLQQIVELDEQQAVMIMKRWAQAAPAQ